MDKNIIKRIVTVILVCLAASAITGCRSGNDNDTAASSGDSSEVTVTESIPDDTSADDKSVAPGPEERSDDPSLLILGKWSDESNKYSYEFKENGKGIYDAYNKKISFTYELLDNNISFLFENNTSPVILEYVLKDDTLDIKDSFGNDTIYYQQY